MNPPYVVLAFDVEEAIEVCAAIKAFKKSKEQRILKPLAPPVVTLETLQKAIKEAGIQEAKLIR